MNKVKEWINILLLPFVIVIAIVAPAVVTRDAARREENLLCATMRANILELQALKEIGREIGIPASFSIPKLPAECVDNLPPTPIISGFRMSDCTHVGTNGNDVMAGTRAKDVMCGRKGNDYVAGNGKPDRLLGQRGHDVIVGGNGLDHMRGGDGADRLFAVDGKALDVVRGGPDHDQCFIDQGDQIRGCDQVFIGGSIKAMKILSEEVFKLAAEAAEVHPPCPPGPC